jgi:deoxyribose-phosphate aldolase
MSDELIARVQQTVSEALGAAVTPAPAGPAGAWVSGEQPLASFIDHTLLKPEATPRQIETLCREALQHQFASVCVNPCYVGLCARWLADSSIAVCTVAGFPLGATTTAAKVLEARQAIAEGAREIDMVLAIGRLKAGDYAAVQDDMAQVVNTCHELGAHCKVILETALLDDADKIAACLLALHVGADFVKTSTGFAASGANAHDVALMRRIVGASAGVKAAGGIRTRRDAETMLEAGASRLGASASVQLVSDT